MCLNLNKTTLKRTENCDLNEILNLWNDGRVMKWSSFPKGLNYNIDHMNNWFSWLEQSKDTKHFSIYSQELFCGEIFYSLNEDNTAGINIKIFPEFILSGSMSDAVSLLIGECFSKEPSIETLFINSSKGNPEKIKIYKELGFKESSNSLWTLEKYQWK